MMSRPLHSTVENLVAVEVAPRQKRVIAVEWGQHDPMNCDGQDLQIDTTGFLACPSSGCRWVYDPEARCPVHGERGDA